MKDGPEALLNLFASR